MYKAIESFIDKSENGLFLLDSPTGFGKTTAVLQIIKDYLADTKFKNAKHMFFVTNLKKNLPYPELFELLTDEEKKQVLIAKSYEDTILENFRKANIQEKEITESEEYKNLKACIDDYYNLHEEIEQKKQDGKPFDRLRSIKKNLLIRVTSCEKQFRGFIQTKFFFGKSFVEKKKYVKDNVWFKILYPISRIEDYKVIFLTTRKFFAPMNVFYRMPFYAYADSLIENSVVFIDEFDATKKDVLNHIIDDSLLSKVDTIKLFKNIHYSLQNIISPKSLLNVTDFNKAKIATGVWDSPEDIIEKNKKLFNEKYSQYNLDYLLKSFDLGYKRAFLFDDGRYITVLKDTSKKYLITKLDKQESFNKLTAETTNCIEKSLNTILREILYCINYFAEGIKRLSKDYHYYKNTTKYGYEDKYNYDEAVMTVLESFNIPNEFSEYLFKLVTQAQLEKIAAEEVECRKGFKFTEVEDSNYHDLQSIAHTFNYNTTPEDLIIMLAKTAKVVGISATASIKTVIGNYDLDYIQKILKDSFRLPSPEDTKRIGSDFFQMQGGKEIKINVEFIDNLNCFSDKEKSQILLRKIFSGEYLDEYLQSMENEQDFYYYLQTVKLVYLYKKVGTNPIYSFVAFLNTFPKKGGDIDLDKIDKMFVDAAKNNDFANFGYSVIRSESFDYEMGKVHEELKQGKKYFVMSTYQTIGSGKNIQYEIPEAFKDNILYDKDLRYNKKDFDGIYLSIPTNLLQLLSFTSENKFKEISKFLFQQEYLYQNKLISYGEMRYNIINGFKRLFFSDKYNVNYSKNKDIYLHTEQYIIQAVGRICRCRHKNKEVSIFADLEVWERISRVRGELGNRLFNAEFSALLNQKVETNNVKILERLTIINKAAYFKIKNMSDTVRASRQNIMKWKDLRDYVLKNPTAAFINSDYKSLYFEFDNEQSGFSYALNNYALSNLKFDKRLDMRQVSEIDCDLPLMLSLPYINALFEKEKYAKLFKANKFVMSISLYQQVYKGALGEVVGKKIIEKQCDIDLEELEDIKHYEFFDYKCGNLYFDFKHWDEFVIDADKYVKKVQRKLNRVKGEKCVVINIVKRGEHVSKVSVDDTVIQIPYLIDDETGDVDVKMTERIEGALI